MQAFESTSTIPHDVARVGLHPVPTITANLPAIMPGQAIDFGQFTPDTKVLMRSGSQDFEMSATSIRQWVAPGAPLSEAMRLLVVARNVNLNPMLKEIELLDIRGSWHIYVRKQGLMKIALRYPEYDGIETGIVIQDKADESKPPVDIPGTVKPRGYLLVGGWAKVWRKGVSRPTYKRIALQDYRRGDKGIWWDNPVVMCEKTALAQALRETFPIGEIYDESELPVQREASIVDDDSLGLPVPSGQLPPSVAITPEVIEAPALTVATVATEAPPAKAEPFVPATPGFDVVDVVAEPVEPHDQPCTVDQQAQLNTLIAKLNMSEATHNKMLSSRGRSKIEELTRLEATQIICKLIEKSEYKTFAS